MDFRFATTPIDAAALARELANPAAGGTVTFEGRVRNANEGRAVVALEYEAFAELAGKEGERILAEARGRFEILAAVCVHRTGRLGLGDLAVWIGVTAAHRGPAFEACRYLIDQIKARVPIWKKEHYVDGASEWINANGDRSAPGPRNTP
jgi:molybdopterin synthase catalytic subunit